jgi:putative DNA primase/helicase
MAMERGYVDPTGLLATVRDKVALPAPKPGVVFSQYPRTDLGSSRAFLDLFGENLRFVEAWKCWIVWEDGRWVEASDIAMLPFAWRVTDEMLKWASAHGGADRNEWLKHAFKTQQDARLRAMINLAKGEPRVRIEPAALDTDPWLLGCPNGTLDLKTGKLREARREDYITKQIGVAFDPAAECPRFRRFLDWTTEGDQGRVAFFQTFSGYSLTGEVREETMCIFVGEGDNGKSTLVMTLHDLLGGYAGRSKATFWCM